MTWRVDVVVSAVDPDERPDSSVREETCKFAIGQLVHHRLFDYRGAIVDVDATFQGTEEWYEQVAKSRPPKESPWYHVLVHDAEHMTYVAEQNLEPDSQTGPISHPQIQDVFSGFEDGRYLRPLN